MKSITSIFLVAATLLPQVGCMPQFQQDEEMVAYSVTPENWKYSASKPVTNMWRVETTEIAHTPEHTDVLSNMPLWMHCYQDGFAGWRYVLTDDPHMNPDGSISCFPVHNGEVKVERIQHYRISSLEDGSLIFSFNAALVSFVRPSYPATAANGAESTRVCGEIMWDLQTPGEGELSKRNYNIENRRYFCTPATSARLNAAGSTFAGGETGRE